MKPKTAHTPGPVKLIENEYGLFIDSKENGRQFRIDRVGYISTRDARKWGYLIAAAPELLEAAKYFLHAYTSTAMSCDDEIKAENRLIAAIATAKGYNK